MTNGEFEAVVLGIVVLCVFAWLAVGFVRYLRRPAPRHVESAPRVTLTVPLPHALAAGSVVFVDDVPRRTASAAPKGATVLTLTREADLRHGGLGAIEWSGQRR